MTENTALTSLATEKCFEFLINNFGETSVQKEWSSFGGRRDIYSPKLDIAVGPFATEEMLVEEYREKLNENKTKIEKLINIHNVNIDEHHSTYQRRNKVTFDSILGSNPKSRCFLGVEIENQVTRKHIIGGIINVTSLSRIAILIPGTDEKYKAMLNMRNYLSFLNQRKELQFNISNLLILKPDQFDLL